MKYIVSLILATLICFGCFAQNNLVKSMSDDLSSLDITLNNNGEKSEAFIGHLLNVAFAYADTCYNSQYHVIADILLQHCSSIKEFKGVDSEEFRLSMVALNRTLLGKYFESSSYESYADRVCDKLAELENDVDAVSNNKIEFATILSGMYQTYRPDFAKALKYGKIKFNETKKNYSKDSDRYAYALTNLIMIYSNLNQSKEVAKLIDEYLATGIQSASVRQDEIGGLINYLPSTTINTILEKLLKEYAYAFGNIENIIFAAQKWGMDGYNDKLSLIEKWVLPSQDNSHSLFRYFESVGIAIGHLNPQKAQEYLKKAIDLAEKNEFTDELFRYSDGEWRHLAQNVAVNYERLNDNKEAANYYLKLLLSAKT